MRRTETYAVELFATCLSLSLALVSGCGAADSPVMSSVPEQEVGTSELHVTPTNSGSSCGGAADGGDAAAKAAPACGLNPTKNDTCNACANSKCLTTCETCAGNAECVALWDCVLTTCVGADGTVDKSCGLNCAVAHPDGIDAFSAFAEGVSGPGCLSTACVSECAKF
jgi:hypothetical protein